MSKFNFGVECDIDDESFEKATKGGEKDRYKNMFVYGLASDASEDLEGQTLYPSGYDFEPLLKSGYVNLEHYQVRKGDPQYWIGEPVSAHVKDEEFFIKAKLWEHSPLARNFYDKIIEMKKSGSKRRPGFSIEGSAIEKDPFNKNRIIKARIKNVAVTFSPVNGNSFLDIVKGQQKQDFITPSIEEITQMNSFIESTPYLFQYEAEDGSIITVAKDFSIRVERNGVKKAMGVESMRPLMPESLDKNMKNLETARTILKSFEGGKINKQIGEKIIRKIFFS